MTELYDENDGVFEDDLSLEIWQDDGESTYFCTPDSCGYAGDGVCSGCGSPKED